MLREIKQSDQGLLRFALTLERNSIWSKFDNFLSP